MGRMTQSTVS